MKLWQPLEIFRQIEGIRPLLASWESKKHPAQIRLQTYLDEVASALDPLPEASTGLFLHLDVDVEEPERLSRHYDLENYLTPLVFRLGAQRFRLVSARKYVGDGSRLLVGSVQPLEFPESEGWQQFSCDAGSGVQSKRWKRELRESLAEARPMPLPAGPVEVHLAWRCAPYPQRNWVSLWKPTGDAMGPVLGEPDPRNPFNPNDDRIVFLGLHLNADPKAGHMVDVTMCWRPVVGLKPDPPG